MGPIAPPPRVRPPEQSLLIRADYSVRPTRRDEQAVLRTPPWPWAHDASMSTNPDLRGTVVLVTGAGRSIGRWLARRLAGHGAALALVARSGDELTGTRDLIRSAG